MNVVIITGGSSGIGKSLAQKFVLEKYKVYSLSRNSPDLPEVSHVKIDLSKPQRITDDFNKLFSEINKLSISSITLINNAGRLGEVNQIENIPSTDLYNTIQLNTTTPFILCSLFIKYTQNIKGKKQIINISSGAAHKPYESWSIYCASKAALDMFTKTIALEQADIENGVKCLSIYPGVVETKMQEQIRTTPQKNFKNRQRFIDLKEQNQLYTTDYVAQMIYKLHQSDELANGCVFDIRNL